MKTQLKPVEIFRAGKHTAMSGQVLEFTADHARQIVEGYSPEVYRAPIVIGHPKIEDPAFGWVDALQLNERGVIEAKPADLEPQFAAMVEAGRFRKVSASLFTPAHPSNPKPGQYYLKHVGFLGAAAPAVSGLKPVQFAESSAEELVVEFSLNDATWSIARMMRNLREWMIAKFDLETADQVIPDYLVTETEAARRESAMPAYAAHPNAEDRAMTEELQKRERELAEKEAALKAKEAQFAARDAEIAAEQAKARRVDIAAFAVGLVKSGRVLPRDEAALVEFMAQLDDGEVIEFAEGEEKKKLACDAWLREFLQRLPKQVDFGEHAGAEGEDAAPANFAAPAGYQVDAQRLELHRKALAHAKQHNLSYEQALAAVR